MHQLIQVDLRSAKAERKEKRAGVDLGGLYGNDVYDEANGNR